MYDDVLNVDEPTATAYRQHPSPPPPLFCASSSKKKEGNKSGKQGAKGNKATKNVKMSVSVFIRPPLLLATARHHHARARFIL